MQISGLEMGIYVYMHVHNVTWEDRDFDNHGNDATDVITKILFCLAAFQERDDIINYHKCASDVITT